MNKRFIAFTLLLLVLWGAGVKPVAASLNEGVFVPCIKSVMGVKQNQTVNYQVKKGDTLWAICQSFKVDLASLTSLNRLNEDSVLTVGQDLKIPSCNSPVYVIKKGDTLWGIASSYGISIDELQKLNSGLNPERLKVGNTINIPANIKRVKSSSEPSRSLGSIRLFFAWPLFGTITSNYGWRSSGFHHGLDIAGKVGDPIKASAGGLVSFVGYKSIYGRTVVLDHSDGTQTLYAHTQKIYVKKGQEVQRGQTIAAVGTSGFTTGPHLHFEIRSGDKTLNPGKYLR
ncbi:MAG: M23 family metallopeptidase [Syntrophomonas sp.]